ncbi:MAG: bifunctional DNA-formamidopyrimidine glycosylase/DNA-(apurinic or apyrimidinic site) lyase [Alphaproteobacteria bacterium]|nr:bifunctional DNA-formamidopyrimidine glycosylase/DNA-(apurinic or apyrimidinic site) lyase [Alphaproteobacteria bacterium]MBR1649460.1 bifunctional DNA-formamidopyrimidine glycosylase/DNA-(apurinic or apyrimidinic site) lyase [Alphaproteobacteria bacterium]
MPELPEVETVKRGIADFIGLSRILDVKIRNRSFREKIPDDFREKIINAAILGYRRIGKYIVIELDNALSVIWHLGMSGRIKTLPDYPLELEKHDHVIIKTESGCLVYNDPRRFGLITYTQTDELFSFKGLKNMGLDPFDEKLDESYLFNHFKNKKIAVKVALLDQSIINGIGNIYASEILYAAKISPLREALSLNSKECAAIVANTRIILQKAIDNGGSTLRDYHKPDGSSGNFQSLHCVYNKTGQHCPECKCDVNKSGGIKKTVQGGRSTFYCPMLQK